MAHCGPTLKGEFARTVNLTDMHIGWVFTRTVRNNAHPHILGALKTGITKIPYKVTGLDFDNGTEFLNKAVIKWAADMEIFFTRSRPYKKNDQATIESKNNHLVRRYGFYYRYDTDEERAVLNRLWHLVNDRLNYLTPTIKPISYGCSRDGHRRRLYDKPQTPGPAAGRRSPLSGPTNRAAHLPQQPQPRRDRPPDRRPASRPAQTRQRQDRTALPRRHTRRSTRPQSRHPHQKQDHHLTPISRAFLT
ncbi:hypothetical protein MSHO_16960 [Mycobacterium shottsii]|uniref:Integrase catalytic domain-containing protein n=1 Tax=Mycobacterium shottsii TaxID=133549 RepID=A0A7I7L8E1_9MYCO|nr:hypothetical protein [Mycobacterium shottsii]BBX55168.1 hypothetical protein MSHO_05130 [Mycobacterium shottsii]BBX55619.1 hypothetical protein MSHO_09640 [Mycobacterium shottsii]BBX56351.1 hypothetical protein MSHO_16960 [Mycobacterium shottsii]